MKEMPPMFRDFFDYPTMMEMLAEHEFFECMICSFIFDHYDQIKSGQRSERSYIQSEQEQNNIVYWKLGDVDGVADYAVKLMDATQEQLPYSDIK